MSRGWGFCVTLGPYTVYMDQHTAVPKYRKAYEDTPWCNYPVEPADIPYQIREQVAQLVELCKQTKQILDQLNESAA